MCLDSTRNECRSRPLRQRRGGYSHASIPYARVITIIGSGGSSSVESMIRTPRACDVCDPMEWLMGSFQSVLCAAHDTIRIKMARFRQLEPDFENQRRCQSQKLRPLIPATRIFEVLKFLLANCADHAGILFIFAPHRVPIKRQVGTYRATQKAGTESFHRENFRKVNHKGTKNTRSPAAKRSGKG